MTPLVERLDQYPAILEALQEAKEHERVARLRWLCQHDLYFLLRYGCGREDMEHPWVFERCREVQASPDGHLDLWSREHYKSTIITFGLTLQNVLSDPEITVGIFSHTRPSAKAFLQQIKVETEQNERLKAWFGDVLWADPAKQSPRWSLDDGLVFRRQGNPREPTVYASGLVDGMPTGFHFRLRVYDDVVSAGSVTSSEVMKKTAEAWQLSDNLGAIGGVFRVVGTRYHANDMYGAMLTSGVVKPRVHPCTRDGSENFAPENCVLMSPETLIEKRRTQGPYTFGTQMLLNPKGDDAQGFKREWITHSKGQPHGRGLNIYILADPANAKTKRSDWTVFAVIGLGADRNYHLLDLVRDRLNLTERTNMLFSLHEKWGPIGTGYETYGLQADIAHIEHEQDQRNYKFKITPLGGSMSKVDRIRRLLPVFEQGRFYMPVSLFRTIYDRSTVDLIHVLIEEELLPFPVATHDDAIDAISRIMDDDMKVRWPMSDEARAARHRQPRVILSPGAAYQLGTGYPSTGQSFGGGNRSMSPWKRRNGGGRPDGGTAIWDLPPPPRPEPAPPPQNHAWPPGVTGRWNAETQKLELVWPDGKPYHPT